jgi:hypothetical protein
MSALRQMKCATGSNRRLGYPLLELLEYRQMKQRVMGMRAHFAFEALDLG